MSSEDAAAVVDAEIARARPELVSKVKEGERQTKLAQKEVDKASRAYTKTQTGDTITEKEKEAWRTLRAANERFLGIYDAMAMNKRKLKALDDPDERQRRIDAYTAAQADRANRRERRQTTVAANGGKTREPRETKAVPAATIAKIKKKMAEGKGAPTIATELNKEKVENPNGADWQHYSVRSAYRTATGDQKAFTRGATPTKTRDRAPAATQRLSTGRKTSSSKKATAKKKTAAKSRTATSGGRDLAKKDVTPRPKPTSTKKTGRKTTTAAAPARTRRTVAARSRRRR